MSKILLVSDNETQNNLIKNFLNKNSINIISSVNENSIIEMAERNQVSMIIIDEEIKELNALILCKKLHSLAIKDNISIVTLIKPNTTNTELLKLSNAYVTKPINETIFIACINGNLKLKRVRALRTLFQFIL